MNFLKTVSPFFLFPVLCLKSFSQDSVEYQAVIFGPVVDGGTSMAIQSSGTVTMGFFTLASSGDLFNGTWTPLVGSLSANPSKPTISFDASGNASTSPGDWEFTPTDSYPNSGDLLAYRIDAPSGYFDYVADPIWTWSNPSNPPPSVTFDFDELGTWQGGNPGTVSLVPEPASFALLAGLLGIGIAATRRRRS